MGRQSELISAQVTIQANTQARRVENLIAILEREGRTFSFKEISGFMKAAGTPFSHTTWHVMRNPDVRVSRFELLNGIAEFFGVPHEFMRLEDAEAPEWYTQQLGSARRLRAEKSVDDFARALRSMDSEGQSYALELLDTRRGENFLIVSG